MNLRQSDDHLRFIMGILDHVFLLQRDPEFNLIKSLHNSCYGVSIGSILEKIGPVMIALYCASNLCITFSYSQYYFYLISGSGWYFAFDT